MNCEQCEIGGTADAGGRGMVCNACSAGTPRRYVVSVTHPGGVAPLMATDHLHVACTATASLHTTEDGPSIATWDGEAGHYVAADTYGLCRN